MSKTSRSRPPSFGIALYPRYSAARTQALAALFEDLGFSHVWIPDQRFNHDLAVVMAQAAMVTSRVKVGSAVTDPFIRHPALTAQMMGSLDDLSGGRVVVGLGTGLAGFRSLGLNPTRPVRAMREAIELMRALWTGETVDYLGATVSFKEGRLEYQPLRERIPIYVAGRGPQVLALAGREAEGVIVGSLASPMGLEYAFRHVDRGLALAHRTRRDLHVAVWLHTAISPSSERAWETVRPIVASVLSSSRSVLEDVGIPLPQVVLTELSKSERGAAPSHLEGLAGVLDNVTMRHFAVAGNAQEVADSIAKLTAAGIDHVAIVPWLDVEQTLEQFSRSMAEALSLPGARL